MGHLDGWEDAASVARIDRTRIPGASSGESSYCPATQIGHPGRPAAVKHEEPFLAGRGIHGFRNVDVWRELDSVPLDPPAPLDSPDLLYRLEKHLAAIPGPRGDGRWIIEIGCGNRQRDPW